MEATEVAAVPPATDVSAGTTTTKLEDRIREQHDRFQRQQAVYSQLADEIQRAAQQVREAAQQQPKPSEVVQPSSPAPSDPVAFQGPPITHGAKDKDKDKDKEKTKTRRTRRPRAAAAADEPAAPAEKKSRTTRSAAASAEKIKKEHAAMAMEEESAASGSSSSSEHDCDSQPDSGDEKKSAGAAAKKHQAAKTLEMPIKSRASVAALVDALATATVAQKKAWARKVCSAATSASTFDLLATVELVKEVHAWLNGSELLEEALQVLDRLPMTVDLLAKEPIGRTIKRLATKAAQPEIKAAANPIFARWKSLVPDDKDKQEKTEPSPKKQKLAPPTQAAAAAAENPPAAEKRASGVLQESGDLDALLSSSSAPEKVPSRWKTVGAQHKTVLLGSDNIDLGATPRKASGPPKRIMSVDDIKKEKARKQLQAQQAALQHQQQGTATDAAAAPRPESPKEPANPATSTAPSAQATEDVTMEPPVQQEQPNETSPVEQAPAQQPEENAIQTEGTTNNGSDDSAGSDGKRRKRVSWASNLVSVREFERVTPEAPPPEEEALAQAAALAASEASTADGDSPRKAMDARHKEAMEERKLMLSRNVDQWHQEKATMEPACPWTRPPLMLLEETTKPRGRESQEREAQKQRDSSVLSKIYFRDDMIPDSPEEPPENSSLVLYHGLQVIPDFTWDAPAAAPPLPQQTPAFVPVAPVQQMPMPPFGGITRYYNNLAKNHAGEDADPGDSKDSPTSISGASVSPDGGLPAESRGGSAQPPTVPSAPPLFAEVAAWLGAAQAPQGAGQGDKPAPQPTKENVTKAFEFLMGAASMPNARPPQELLVLCAEKCLAVGLKSEASRSVSVMQQLHQQHGIPISGQHACRAACQFQQQQQNRQRDEHPSWGSLVEEAATLTWRTSLPMTRDHHPELRTLVARLKLRINIYGDTSMCSLLERAYLSIERSRELRTMAAAATHGAPTQDTGGKKQPKGQRSNMSTSSLSSQQSTNNDFAKELLVAAADALESAPQDLSRERAALLHALSLEAAAQGQLGVFDRAYQMWCSSSWETSAAFSDAARLSADVHYAYGRAGVLRAAKHAEHYTAMGRLSGEQVEALAAIYAGIRSALAARDAALVSNGVTMIWNTCLPLVRAAAWDAIREPPLLECFKAIDEASKFAAPDTECAGQVCVALLRSVLEVPPVAKGQEPALKSSLNPAELKIAEDVSKFALGCPLARVDKKEFAVLWTKFQRLKGNLGAIPKPCDDRIQALLGIEHMALETTEAKRREMLARSLVMLESSSPDASDIDVFAKIGVEAITLHDFESASQACQESARSGEAHLVENAVRMFWNVCLAVSKCQHLRKFIHGMLQNVVDAAVRCQCALYNVLLQMYNLLLQCLEAEGNYEQGVVLIESAFKRLPKYLHGPLWRIKITFLCGAGSESISPAALGMTKESSLLQAQLYVTLAQSSAKLQDQQLWYDRSLKTLSKHSMARGEVALECAAWMAIAGKPSRMIRSLLRDATVRIGVPKTTTLSLQRAGSARSTVSRGLKKKDSQDSFISLWSTVKVSQMTDDCILTV
eukprot:m51a1_g3549 hypothetical protein (1561) ;mRNA; f:1009316-1017698